MADKTDNGFYVGDLVSYTNHKGTEVTTHIEKILQKGLQTWLGDGKDTPYQMAPRRLICVLQGDRW